MSRLFGVPCKEYVEYRASGARQVLTEVWRQFMRDNAKGHKRLQRHNLQTPHSLKHRDVPELAGTLDQTLRLLPGRFW
jgi:hypothetical protein